MAKNALGQVDASILACKIHLCKKTPPIPNVPFLYHFEVFSELRTERQKRKGVAIAEAPLGEIFIHEINL